MHSCAAYKSSIKIQNVSVVCIFGINHWLIAGPSIYLFNLSRRAVDIFQHTHYSLAAAHTLTHIYKLCITARRRKVPTRKIYNEAGILASLLCPFRASNVYVDWARQREMHSNKFMSFQHRARLIPRSPPGSQLTHAHNNIIMWQLICG